MTANTVCRYMYKCDSAGYIISTSALSSLKWQLVSLELGNDQIINNLFVLSLQANRRDMWLSFREIVLFKSDRKTIQIKAEEVEINLNSRKLIRALKMKSDITKLQCLLLTWICLSRIKWRNNSCLQCALYFIVQQLTLGIMQLSK